MNSKTSKSHVIRARNTRTPNAVNTPPVRHLSGYRGRLNANTGSMTRFRSEIERLRHENAILREERSEIYLNASYMMAHS